MRHDIDKRQTYTSKEREIRKGTLVEQTLLIGWYAIADVYRRINLRRWATEGIKGVQLRDRDRVLDPGEKLFVGNDPYVLLFLHPIQVLVDHVDGRAGRIDTGVRRL